MLKILIKIFPIFDYLYLFQILEYNPYEFLKWVFQHLFSRNLQKKHHLKWTAKIKLLFFISLLLVISSTTLVFILLKSFFLTLLLFLILQQLSPPIILLAHFIYFPLDYYFKQSTIRKARGKLQSLPSLQTIIITGSFGKTSTKEILYTLLNSQYRSVRTPKSFNTILGIAKTILEDVKSNTQLFIVEAGAYQRGEIDKIAQLLKPQIAVITAIAPQHLQRFGSLENIALAKFEVAQHLSPNGLLVLNSESPELVDLASKSPAKTLFYGKNTNPFFISGIKTSTQGTSFKLHTPKGTAKIYLPIIGKHHAQNFLAAATIAINYGLTLEEIRKRAALILPTPHRLEIQRKEGWTIIDNTYNTNPQSAEASLKLLQSFPGNQKIIITPGLVELGEKSSIENQIFAGKCAFVADLIIIVGEHAKNDLLAGLKSAKFNKKRVYLTSSLSEALGILPLITLPLAVILLENDLPDQYF